jgi:teichuronic acid exporter
MDNLRSRTVMGIIWSVIERLSVTGFQLVLSVILARLLEPAQFGLIGMLSLFMALAQSLVDSGFGSALIQRKDASQTDKSSILYLNIIVGLLLSGLLFLCSPAISNFYNQPILTPLTRFLSLNIIINSFCLVQASLLTKKMEFKGQMKVSLISVSVSGALGVGLAFMGYGVWSLAIQSVAGSLCRCIMLWIINPWRPTATFSIVSIRSIFSFGSKLLVSGLIETFFQNIHQTFIGKIYSPAALGFYTRANTFQKIAVDCTSGSLGKVMYPALIPHQDNVEQLKRAYRKTIGVSIFFHFPLMVGLWAIAEPLILFLMTDKWAQSIPYFRLLCISGFLYPLHVLNLNILKVKGRSDLFLRLEVIKKVMIILAILMTYKEGIVALLYGQIATSVISYIVNSYYSGRMVNYPTAEQLTDLLPVFTTACLMGGVMYLVGIFSPEVYSIQILAQGIIGSGFYLIISWIMKSSALIEIKDIAFSTLKISPAPIKGL